MPLDQAALRSLIEACLRDRMRARPYPADPELIRRTLALEPLPARTDLAVQHHGSADGDDWARRTVSFESQPGVRVPATVYTPLGDGRRPLVVVASDSWEHGRRSPCLQALGIALSIQGFVVVTLEPPGTADRAEMGDPLDMSLSAAITAQGVFAWDLMRAADMAVSEYGADPEKIGILGVGVGGEAAFLAAAVDERFRALAVAGAGHSQEPDISEAYHLLPGVAEIGDWANLVVHRAPMPMLFLSAATDNPEQIDETVQKLQRSYKGKKESSALRLEQFLGPRDLSRRMRETVAAFFLEHLVGRARLPYVVEPLPLTDGIVNPRPANTEDPALLSVSVSGLSLTDLRDAALTLPYPHPQPDLVPWGKYGRLEPLEEVETLHIADHGATPDVIALPHIDPRLLIPLGLSVPDFYAQLLHLLLPGGPEGWEPLAMQGDALTAMIASVRTLMKKADAKVPPKKVTAQGPVSSLTARLLGHMRPSLEIEVSHEPRSWQEVLMLGVLVPGARYRAWPWPSPSLAESLSPSPPEVDKDWDEERLAIDEADDPDSLSPSHPSPHSPSGGEGKPEHPPEARGEDA